MAEQMLCFREASEHCISGLTGLEACQSNAAAPQEWYHTEIVSCGYWALSPWKDHSRQTLFASCNEEIIIFLGVKRSFKIPDFTLQSSCQNAAPNQNIFFPF